MRKGLLLSLMELRQWNFSTSNFSTTNSTLCHPVHCYTWRSEVRSSDSSSPVRNNVRQKWHTIPSYHLFIGDGSVWPKNFRTVGTLLVCACLSMPPVFEMVLPRYMWSTQHLCLYVTCNFLSVLKQIVGCFLECIVGMAKKSLASLLSPHLAPMFAPVTVCLKKSVLVL